MQPKKEILEFSFRFGTKAEQTDTPTVLNCSRFSQKKAPRATPRGIETTQITHGSDLRICVSF